MGDTSEALTDEHIDFISNRHLFFVGTAAADGCVNVSPKGMETFRVIGASRVVWSNPAGSGNETAAHVRHRGLPEGTQYRESRQAANGDH